MNRDHVDAAGILGTVQSTTSLNKDRTEWKLSEWSQYFNPASDPVIMSPKEIAAAVMWLVERGYPVPVDCPKKSEVGWSFEGGCPAFKPVCLTHKICQMARGMCNEIGGTSRCPTCNEMFDPSALRDSLSRKECGISGMCQECQDRIFGR